MGEPKEQPAKEPEKVKDYDYDEDPYDEDPYYDYDEDYEDGDREERTRLLEMGKKMFHVGARVQSLRHRKVTGVIILKEQVTASDKKRLYIVLDDEEWIVAWYRILTDMKGKATKTAPISYIHCDDVESWKVVKVKMTPAKKTDVRPASDYLKEFGF